VCIEATGVRKKKNHISCNDINAFLKYFLP
jgi:hypothetical protein